MQTVRITHCLAREIRFYDPSDPAVPAALFTARDTAAPPDLTDVREPLPSRKDQYACFAKTDRALGWARRTG